MLRNKALERIRSGEKALGVNMYDPIEELVEMAGRMGLDFVNFEGQHAPMPPERVATPQQLRAALSPSRGVYAHQPVVLGGERRGARRRDDRGDASEEGARLRRAAARTRSAEVC